MKYKKGDSVIYQNLNGVLINNVLNFDKLNCIVDFVWDNKEVTPAMYGKYDLYCPDIDMYIPSVTVDLILGEDVSNTKNIYITWLEGRIIKTEAELEKATEVNLKISKGAKLCAYKECMNYINEHK
jgi:hypothetical protein